MEKKLLLTILDQFKICWGVKGLAEARMGRGRLERQKDKWREGGKGGGGGGYILWYKREGCRGKCMNAGTLLGLRPCSWS